MKLEVNEWTLTTVKCILEFLVSHQNPWVRQMFLALSALPGCLHFKSEIIVNSKSVRFVALK